MPTKLRLLLDECVQAPLAQEIQKCAGISSIEHVNDNHPLGNSHTPDAQIIEYATKHKRLVVTVETRFDEFKFPICTHPGIIVLKATARHEVEKAKIFKQFMKSGHRKKCNHAVTTLTADGFERREKVNGRLQIITGRF